MGGKSKKDQDQRAEQEQAAQLGDDEQAHPGVDHSHAGYLSQEDAEIRLQRATGDSRAPTPQE